MPAYDYQATESAKSCDKCRNGFEDVHGMNESGPETCPECGNPVRRAWHAPQVNDGHWSSKRLLNKDNLRKHGFQTGSDLLESGKLGKD